MKSLKEIEERMLRLRGRLLVIYGLVEETTNPAQLRMLNERYEEVREEIEEANRDLKMTEYRLRQKYGEG